MIKILDNPGEKVITTVAITEILPEDWARVLPALENKIQQFGTIRWCVELRDFGQNSGPAGREENGLSRFSSKGFERIAIIGNKDCRGWAEDLMQAIAPAEIRFFETIYQDEAHKWVNS